MKKLILSVLLVSLISFAFSSDWNFEFTPFFELRNGQQDELVYTNCFDGEKRKLSELNWEQKNIYLVGLETSLFYKNIFLSAKVKSAFPKKSGTLRDSDWQNCSINNTFSDDVYNIKTNYSESDCTLKKFYQADFALGYEFDVNPKFSFSPFAGIDFCYVKYHAKDGEGQYSTVGSNKETIEFYNQNGYYSSYELANKIDILSIELESISLFTWIGSKIYVTPTERFSFEVMGAISPFVRSESIDSHFSNSAETDAKYYLDIMTGYFCAFKGSFRTFLKLTNKLYFTLGIEGMASTTIKGITKIKNSGSSKKGNYTKISSTSGCSFSNISTNLGLKIRL